MTNNDTKEAQNMFVIFQIEKTKEYPATRELSVKEALLALAEFKKHNPTTKFEIREI